MSQLENKIKYFGNDITPEEFERIKQLNCKIIHECLEPRGTYYRHGKVEYSNDIVIYFADLLDIIFVKECTERLELNGYRLGVIIPSTGYDKMHNIACTIVETDQHG